MQNIDFGRKIACRHTAEGGSAPYAADVSGVWGQSGGGFRVGNASLCVQNACKTQYRIDLECLSVQEVVQNACKKQHKTHLELSWAYLGLSWSCLGLCWACLGQSWHVLGHLGAISGHSKVKVQPYAKHKL